MNLIFFGLVAFFAGWGFMDVLLAIGVPLEIRYILLMLFSIFLAVGIGHYGF